MNAGGRLSGGHDVSVRLRQTGDVADRFAGADDRVEVLCDAVSNSLGAEFLHGDASQQRQGIHESGETRKSMWDQQGSGMTGYDLSINRLDDGGVETDASGDQLLGGYEVCRS